jgi:23S rRNA (cytosine1962-C5)-methyltransferase
VVPAGAFRYACRPFALEAQAITGIPTVRLKRDREKSLRRRHPWIFSGAIERVSGEPASGETVRVETNAGEFIAFAAFSPASQIRLRVWSFDEKNVVDDSFIGARVEQAITMRRSLGLDDGGACRLVFGEADGLPGLVVDRYGEFLVCQFLAAGVEVWREAVVAALQRLLSPRGIYERSDASVRRKEGLAPGRGRLAGEAPPTRLELVLDGLRQLVDIAEGQKTGGYLDQRVNRLRVAEFAQDRSVLDAYAYTGGFGLQCLRAGAIEATFLDSSAPALEAVTATAALNGLEDRCRCAQADVADELRALHASGRRFDLIVLDPPKFVHTAGQVTKGCRAYKDINRLAFLLLSPGGVLASFSCSGHVDAALLQKVIAQAAVEAGRDAQIIERLGQPADHPVALQFPEGEYLKGFVLRA